MEVICPNTVKYYFPSINISGMHRVVIVNKIEDFREALVTRKTDFAGRPTISVPMRIESMGFRGVGSSDYTRQWIFVRKLAYKSMHLFGNGLQKVEDIIRDEIDIVCLHLINENGKPIPVHVYFGKMYTMLNLTLCPS